MLTKQPITQVVLCPNVWILYPNICKSLFSYYICWRCVAALCCCSMHTHTHLTAPFQGLPGWASSRKVKPIWILLKQETVSGRVISWPYASLHLIPDRQPHQYPTTQFFTGRMSFLPPNQQRQSTEDISDQSISPAHSSKPTPANLQWQHVAAVWDRQTERQTPDSCTEPALQAT